MAEHSSTTSRRSLLGLLAAAPVAGVLAGPGTAVAASDTASDTASGTAYAQGVPRDLRPGGAFDRLLAKMSAEDTFSGTVLLTHRGRPVLARVHGMANRERGVANTLDTVFGVASITKMFTAVAIAQLAQQGKLAFHAALGSFLDGFPADIADTVTVHHLLTHTSGIGRPPIGNGPMPGLEWDSFEEVMAGNLDIIRRTPAQFAPGTRHAYTNDGFHVLGAIVARVSGISYFDYVRRHVFAPAGMTQSDFLSRPQVQASSDIARPYMRQPGGGRVDASTTDFFPFSSGPAGGAYSTVADLTRFSRALRSGKLLEPVYADLVTGGKIALPPASAPSDPPAQAHFYCYGFTEAVMNNRRVSGHSGGGPGMSNRLDMYPALDWSAVILGNYDNPLLPLVDLERRLITA